MSSGTLVLGLINGMLTGLLAVGIVLVYKSNRFLNLAHAQLGALSAQLLAKLVIDFGWSWWVAFGVCVPVGIVVGVAVERWVVRPLRARSASAVSLLLVTVGVTQVLLALALIPDLGPSPTKMLYVGYPLPFQASVHVGGVVLHGADILVLVLGPALVAGLAVFLRFTLLGTMIRAAASNPDAARLSGVSTARVSAITWAIAGGLSAVAAILQFPSFGSNGASAGAALGPQLLLLALGAAAVGAFTSLPLALAGGLLIGLAQQIALALTSNAGTAELVVFLVVMGIVLLRGRAIGRVFSTAGAVVEDRPPLRIPEAVRGRLSVRYGSRAVLAGALVVGILVPLMPILQDEGTRFDLALVLVYALVSLSLTVAIGWAGQVTLGQFAFVGAGAFVAAHLMPKGWSVLFLLLICGIVGALLMAVVALPALRVPGLTLAVTTLGFAVIAPDWLFHKGWFGSAQPFGIVLQPPSVATGVGAPSSQLFVYYLAFGAVVVGAVAMWALRRSQPGRLIIAVRDNEAKAATFRVTPTTVKVGALCVSGFLAGSAGVLWADAWRQVSATQFPADLSLAVLAAVVIGGIGSIAGAVAGGVVVYGLTFLVNPYVSNLFSSQAGSGVGFELLLGGIGLILALRKYPQGIAGAVQSWWQGRIDQMAVETETRVTAAAEGPALRVDGVGLSFGGQTALDEVSIEVDEGEIVGLIGPNGAGKTTLLNVISGVLRADAGAVFVSGVDVSGFPPELRATFGLGRSFQQASLFPGLTVTETMQVAMSTQHRVGVLASATSAPWVRAGEVSSRQAALALLERFGLTRWADVLTDELSTGTRRICDLAAQVAAGPRLLLLDEPTGGVAQRDAEAFGPLLKSLREELGLSVLIVEHDMPLLMGLCDRVYALDLGRVIAEGTPDEVRADPAVIVSYLGTDGAPAGPPSPEVTRRFAEEEQWAQEEQWAADDYPDGEPAGEPTPPEPQRPLRQRPLRARPVGARPTRERPLRPR
jgi:ABC-type branched-subunit amino acid transport system ATPase component/branched-subunit amino acid ABC-type transport system permease component